jgi:PAS domain S-box-containing protein
MDREAGANGTGNDHAPSYHRDSIIGALADVVFELDGEGTISAVTGELEESLGYDPSEVMGTPLPELVADVGRQPAEVRSRDALIETLQSEEALTNLDVSLEATGERVVSASLSVVAVDDTTSCILQDVREYGPKAQERQRYAELVREMGDPLYVLDERGTIEWVNDAMVAYMGYERSALRGRAMSELVPTREYEQVTQRLLDLAGSDNRRSERFETPLVTKEGEARLTEANVTVLTDEDGSYAGSIGTLRDIGDRKRRERDLELLKQVLTRVFRHNVRNDLNIVEGHATILDEHVEGDLEEHTQAILNTAEQLLDHSNKARLLEQVIESDRLHETDIRTAVDDLVASHRETAPDAAIEVDVPEGTTVEAHSHVVYAIEELIENAIRHATEEDPWVRIWTDKTEEFLTLFVEDSAGGLDDHEIGVLREGVESRLEHSSGVGLWLVRWIVESSGADMIAHRTGGGSLMGIRFPRSDRERAGTGTVEDSPVTRTPTHVRGDTSPQRLDGETVVGRRPELHRLEDTYDRLEQTGGHAVLLTGESGIGKSTLVEQFRDLLGEREEPPLVASGGCDGGVTPPYTVFRELMADIPAGTGLEELLAEISAFETEDPETVHSRKQALFADVADELRDLAREQTVVLVLEDLQWASQGTLDLLDYLIDEVGQWAPSVLFVCTCQTGDVETTHPVLNIVEETAEAGRGTVLELEPFDTADVRQLLTAMLDIDSLPDGFVTDVHDHTGGTPLFVAEIGRHLADTLGPSPSPESLPDRLDSVSVPATVETAVTKRIESLDDTGRSVLELGAVIGTTISFDVLREASECQETELVETVDRLVRRHLWDRSGGTLTFVHGMVREKTLEKIPERRRTDLHGRVARAIETVNAGSLSESYGQLATHYEESGGDETAIDYFRGAGDRAADAYAHEDAVEFYEQAVRVARDHDGTDDSTLATLRGNLAHSFRSLGEYDRARENVTAGLEVVADRSPQKCRLLGIRAGIESDQSQFDRARETAERQQSLATELGARDHESSALRQLGTLARQHGAFERASDHFQESLAIAQETGNRHATGVIHKELGTIALRQSDYEQARMYYTKSLEIARERDARQLESACLTNLGAVAYRQGNYDQALEYWQQTRELKRDIGDRRGVAKTLSNLGLIAERQGNYDQAISFLEESLATKRTIGDRHGEAHTLNTLGMVARKRGEYDQSLRYLESSLEISRDIDASLCEAWALENRGQVALLRSDYQQAGEYFERALALGRELSNAETEASGLCGLGAVALREGEYETAREYLTTAHDQHLDGGEPLQHGKIHLEQACLELTVADPAAAREHVEKAHEKFAEVDAVHWVGRCQRLLGGIADASGCHSEARQHWEDALETFEPLDTPQEVLTTLKCLVEHSDSEDDRERWVEHARTVLSDAPDAVVTQHETWVERSAVELGLSE